MKRFLLLLFIVLCCTGAGYEGQLPDLESGMSYKIKTKTVKPPYSINNKEPVLKNIPRENKEYVDIIIKKSRTSEYIKDIQPVIDILEKFKNYIEDEKNIQMFNAVASNFIDHAYYIQRKYHSRPERNYASYRAVISLAEDARAIASFKAEGVTYTKYLPFSEDGQKYSKENIKNKDEDLLKKIYNALYVLKNLD